ncbi:MAG TPA: ATP-binding protein [Pseudomonadales bacterium]
MSPTIANSKPDTGSYAKESISNKAAPDLNNWRLLQVYSYYRLFISATLVSLLLADFRPSDIGQFQPKLFLYTLATYTLFNICSLPITHRRIFDFNIQAFTFVLFEITCLILFTHSSGGITSNLAILLMVSVAAGNILIASRLATLLAAIATLAVIFESFYFTLHLNVNNTFSYSEAGIMGIAFFATAFLANGVAKRLRDSEILASEQALDLASLEKLNRQIIQRMRTGIIALDKDNNIKLINETALHLLNNPPDALNKALKSVSADLATQHQQWQSNPLERRTSFRANPNTPEIIANFAPLEQEPYDGTLIFLDDKTQLAQQAQNLKLASLGTLTAGIAHEIRNPLGAVSHAAQLLNESPELNNSDSRLIQIIQTNSTRMNAFIENILELSRRKTSQQQLFPLKGWLEKFILDFTENSATDSSIQLDISPDDIEVRIDSNQLIQVLTNLCENGLRYSKEKTGEALVYLHASLNTENLPQLDIIDRGDGIEPDLVDHVFEPFFTTEKTGTGLGLYIARELCESNQARLYYIPAASGGGCFRITFAHPGRIAQ